MPNILLCCSGSVATIKVPFQNNIQIQNRLMTISSKGAWTFGKASCWRGLQVGRLKFWHNGQIWRLTFPQCSVRLVVTENSRHFLPSLPSLGVEGEEVFVDAHEWERWKGRGDPVLHIELRKWADIALVAPCSANTLAKLASGLADNLLSSTLRWESN